MRHRLRMLRLLIGLGLRALFGRVVFVHFKALNSGPFALLGRLNRRRTIFFEGNCWGYHKLMMERIGNIARRRAVPSWTSTGDVLIGFSPEWPALSHRDNAGKQKLVVPSSHLSKAWLDFTEGGAERYLAKDFESAGVRPRYPYLVYILGYFGKFDFLAAPDTMRTLFDETLEILSSAAAETPILLKPHAITDVSIVTRALAGYPRGRFIVSHLHPAVLASRAVAFIGNHYSTTFADAATFSVPVIEYTEYNPKVLAMTGGGSMRPEHVTHFINRDQTRLRAVIEELLEGGRRYCRPPSADAALRPALRLLAG
jgi:hypothetical protein